MAAKTMKASSVIAKIAGIESIAKMRSVVARTTTTATVTVAPGQTRFSSRRTMFRSGCTSSLEWRASLTPVATRRRPKR